MLIATADMTDDTSQINSFILSNMAPQHPNHNRYAWKNWENYTRFKAEKKKYLLVITGVTGDKKLNIKTLVETHNTDFS